MTQFRSAIRRPRTAQPVALAARQVGAAYHYPFHVDGTGYTGAIIELGGGLKVTQQQQAITAATGGKSPSITVVLVGKGKNKEDGPDGADGEVDLDIQVAGQIAPGMAMRIYIGGNNDADFVDAIKQALADGCNGISISWGGPEDSWDPASITAMDAAIAACRAAGVPVFVAAGDSGADDGEGNPVVDFPASSPSAIGCGGTRLTINSDGSRSAETVWNDSSTSSATGGGVSKVFSGRQVPDVAANADPDTGYEVVVDGESMVVGGTSAVAPLMLGLHALLFQIHGGKPFDFLNTIVTNPQACFDVTVGNNGAYRAGPGRDDVTGYGVPDGGLLEQVIDGGNVPTPIPQPVPSPPSPTPVPTPAPPAGTNPLADFPSGPVSKWVHDRTYTKAEQTAKGAIVAWAAPYGLVL